MAIVGIDLGTTNSLVAVWRDGAVRLLANALGERLTPSVVGLDGDADVLVGRPAHDRLLTHPDRTVASFKRWMGTNRTVRLGKRSFRAEDLSSLVLRSLKADAEADLGEPVTQAVISVPAYFSDAQRKATRAAGELAGLEVRRLVNEPTAAALAYALHETGNESTFVILDLGGGTFDVSVLELYEGVMEVRASAGDAYLGGDDFTASLRTAALEQFGLRRDALKPSEQALLSRHVERLKLRLSEEVTAELALELAGRARQWSIDRERFEALVAPLIQRMRRPIERALRDANLQVDHLDGVVLVGGATRMPMVRSLAARLFGQLPLSRVHPDETVALGAAVQAGLVARDSALREVVMTDTAPYSLGVDVVVEDAAGRPTAGQFDPIIERNTTVPVSREKRFCTVSDWQTRIHLGVYQGESRLVEDNVKLGVLKVAVPRDQRGVQSVDVRFTYDVNGLLEVDARVVSTGRTHNLVIESNPGILTQAEIAARLEQLKALKMHPRDQLENRAIVTRGERIYEEFIRARSDVQRALVEFEAAVERQEPAEIERAREAISAQFDAIERDSLV